MLTLASARSSLLAFMSSLLLAAVAQGQGTASLAENLQRQLNVEDAMARAAYFRDTPIADRLLLDAGGSFRYGFYMLDTPRSQKQYLQQPDLRLFLLAELDGAHRFFGRLRFEYNEWDFRGTRPTGTEAGEEGWQNPIGEIYWYQFDLAGLLASQGESIRDFNVQVRGGRQYYIWTTGLVLSNYIYGAQLDITLGDFVATGMYGQTAGSDTVDFDTSRPGFDNDTARKYAGGKLEYRGISGHRPYAFYMTQVDGNAGQQTVIQPNILGGVPTTFRYNSNYLGFGSSGSIGPSIIYRAEFVQQWGTTLSDPLNRNPIFTPETLAGQPLAVPQQPTSINAQAGLVGLTWLARDESDFRIDLQVVVGSGDKNRLDSGTTFGGIAPRNVDNAFNSNGYINTGLALAPAPTNMVIPSLGVSLNPLPTIPLFKDLRYGITGYIFNKTVSDAPISVLTRPGVPFIGGEIDQNLDWRISSDLNLNIRYGIFIPHKDAFFPNEGKIRQFFYVGMTYAF
ncbi:MAG: alginate export family protein [Phycisphaeraceae bacterium]|nr:alginate export family protein [Phycisphaeraceae bacterium]